MAQKQSLADESRPGEAGEGGFVGCAMHRGPAWKRMEDYAECRDLGRCKVLAIADGVSGSSHGEVAAQAAHKPVEALNNTDDPNSATPNLPIIHLHGYVQKWDIHNIRDSCVLGAESYSKLTFVKKWLDCFRRGTETGHGCGSHRLGGRSCRAGSYKLGRELV